MKIKVVSALAAIALMAGLVSAPVASAKAPIDGEVTVAYNVPTRHGKMFLEVVHPTSGGEIVKAPMVLTISPYSYALGRNGDSGNWVPRGYARGTADVIGIGNSGGCYDYGGKREKETGYDVVEWVAKQKWSTGKIGMIGGSYDGTTANAAAVMRPPHLTTIVPEAAINHWYGYAYSGGIRFFLQNGMVGHQGPGAAQDEGFDTPLLFDGGLAIPPPIDAQSPHWAEKVQENITPCDEVTHIEHGYDDTPDYDKFWVERDYLKDASKVTIPVLVAGNWGDWNVKQDESWDWYNALKNSEKRVLYMGTVHNGHGTPSGDYGTVVNAWMDHYLMNKDNGIENLPTVISKTADLLGDGKEFKGAPKVTNVTLYAQFVPPTAPGQYAWQLGLKKPHTQPVGFGPQQSANATVAAFPSTNINTESHALHHGQSNHDWFWFEGPTLKKNVRIFGSPKVQVFNTVYRKWVTVTPTLADVDPSQHVFAAGNHVATSDPNMLVGITRGWLDSRYREGLDKQVDLEPGKPWLADVTLNPVDYTFLADHFIGLNIQTEINEWSLPKPYPGCDQAPDVPPSNPTDPSSVTKGKGCQTFKINWEEAKTRLILPIVDAPKNVASLFHPPGHAHGE
jgi:X-Pro dipeptidyl-peptidase